MENGTESGVITWTTPECPFRIEYSARALDEIRLAVVDAFFSLPRGGAEIGGVLLGDLQGDQITVNGYDPLDCEHALGPSFTLSPKDQANLAEMTARAKRNAPNLQPVGWYHSHTRSEIFLSEADQDLHNRYFPEPWQIALVLKPHIFEPTRGGFFFREPDGSIHGAASYREFQLEPLPLRLPGAGNGNQSTTVARPIREPQPPVPTPAIQEPAETVEKGKRRVPITREIVVEPPLSSPTVETEPDLPVPQWAAVAPRRSWGPMKAVLILAIGVALGGVGYQTREDWLPKVLTKARAVLPKEPEPYLSLGLADDNGQLKIRWDRYAPAIREALEATIEISDGDTAPQSVRLDGAHLATGTFLYARQHERVDVTLIASEPGGKSVKEQSSFLGKLPRQAAVPDTSPAATADKDRADKLEKYAYFQAARIKKLETDLKAAQDQLQILQKDKQESPTPDPTKKN